MKNWEAMLKGAKMRPQTFVSMVDDRGSCAVGAMFEGHGNTLDHTSQRDAWALVHELDYAFPNAKCPVCKVGFGLGTAIWHLNDTHEWSRENIAYFVRAIEDPKAAKKQETKIAVTV